MKQWLPRKNSPEWEEFKAYLQRDLLECYQVLANLATSPTRTEQVRGRAAYINKLLSLDKGHSAAVAAKED